MDINGDAVADLENGGVTPDDDGIITPPSTVPATRTPPLVKVADNPEAHIEPTDAEVTKLVNPETTFAFVKDGAAKVVELKEIENTILGQECINQGVAEYAQQFFGNIVTESVSLASFTQVPSRTNFAYATSMMRTRISKEEAETVCNLTDFRNRNFMFTAEYFTNATARYLPNLISEADRAAYYARTLKEAWSGRAVVNVCHEQEFFPLGKFDIQTIDFTKFDGSDVESIRANVYAGNIRKALESYLLKAMIHGVNDGKDLGYICGMGPRVDYAETPITVDGLISFLSSSLVTDYIRQFSNTIQTKQEEIEALSAKMDSIKSAEEVVNFCSENEATVQDINKVAIQSAGMVVSLGALCRSAIDMMKYLQRF